MLLLSGCAVTEPKSFILKTDLPADFKITADIYYLPATGETCTMPPTTSSYIPGRKRLKSERQEVAHSVEFTIPLSDTAGGCPLVLRSVRFDMQGKWGPDDSDMSNDGAGISFVDLSDSTSTPDQNNKIYNGECQWLFRTDGSERHIIKILKCRAVDEGGRVLKQLAGGVLERDSLVNKTVNVSFKVAEEGKPYYKGSWLKTPVGWKPCTGRWGTKNEEFCTVPPKFTDFKMSDGRICTVYPNCTE